MKAKDLFGLLIRVVGLAGVIWGLFYVISAVYCFTGGQPAEGFTANDYLLAGIVTLVLGIYFLRGAPHVLRFAYPEPKEKKETEDESEKAAD